MAAKMHVPPSYDTTGIQHFHIPAFRFHHGATAAIAVAYRRFNPAARATVLIPTCYGGRINETLRFADGALADRHVVVVAMLGNGESASPSTQADFPAALDYRDVVRAQYALLTEGLGITHLEAVLGFSMGGQQAYYWAKMYPHFITSAIPICGSAQTSAHNYAFLASLAGALVGSSDYAAYAATGAPPLQGLRTFARTWAPWLFSAAWFRAGHWRANGATTLDEWLATEGETSLLDWDPKDLLILLAMWQRGDVASFRADGRLDAALAEIEVPVLVMPCRTDTYFAYQDSENEIRHLQKPSRLEIIESVWGHPAGGGINPDDTKWMDGKIAEWLQERSNEEGRTA